MTLLCLFRWLPILLFAISAAAQQPNLAAITKPADRIDAWLAYCENLRLNPQGAKDNFAILGQAAAKGIALVPPDDALHRAKFFFYSGISQYYKHRFDSAQYYFYNSLGEAKRSKSTGSIEKACVALIPVNFQLGQAGKDDECRDILKSIVDTARSVNLLEDGYYGLGSFYQQKSYYNTAQDYFIKSLEMREKVVDTTKDLKKKFDYAIQCDMLSKLYLNTQMAEKSLNTLRRAQRFATVSQNVNNRLLSSFVEAFTSSGNIDSAKFYDMKLEEDSTRYRSFPSEVVSSNLNIGIYYMDHADYHRAEPYLDHGAKVATALGNPLLIFQVDMAQGRFFEETGAFDRSIPLLATALPIARQFSRELYGNTLKYMALAQKGKGNARAALQFFEEYGHQSDTLTKEKLDNNFADQETRYETTQKEERISSLDQENRLQVLELQNASRTRLLLVVGLVALSVIALLLYFIYRNKEKLNTLLNKKNLELGELNHQLGRANNTKAKLFGIIGHDLRSPIGRIVQLLQIQKDNPGRISGAEKMQHEKNLRTSSENLLETMEDLLLWSKSQMDHFTPQVRKTNLADIAQREADFLQPLADEKHCRILQTVSGAWYHDTDENFVTVILRNLIQNAVKYNTRGDVVIRSEGKRLLVINHSSADAAMLNGLLENKQIDSSSSGLGLQMAADLAKAIHAKIHFQPNGNTGIAAVLTFAG